jgi:VCBS repeat protein
MLNALILAALAAAPAGSAPADQRPDPELSPPVRIEAAGKPIETGSIGHAAPFVADFDGDGKPDLLVGQFEGGKLTIYRNEGTARQPRLASGQPFKAGADLGVVPAG